MKDGQPKTSQPETIQLKDYQVPPYLIDTTELVVELNETVSEVQSTLKIIKNPASVSKLDELVLDGSKDLDTRSISIDGRELVSNEYIISNDKLTLFNVPQKFELIIRVEIKPQENTALEGLYKSGDMFCSQCEAEGFRNITWFMDRPDVMSKYTTTIHANKQSYPVLLSNGNEVARGEYGARHWVTWQDPFDKPAYLFALVAGDLEFIEDSFTTQSGRAVKLQIFTEAHNIDKLDHAMLSLKKSMAWDEKVYGREYDLDIFMIVAVESFNMGAMENKGLNIFNTSCVLARADTTTDAMYQRVEGVVAHEYFHNWSGNRVTCRDWFQLSLKEGFTVLRDQQFSSDMGSAAACRCADVSTLRAAQFPEDAGPMSHPIRPDSYIEINNFYTATVYEKGAEVVRMIRTLVGESGFRRGTDLYFDRHDGQAVTTEDFVKAMEDANEYDLGQFRRWYSQSGTPLLKVTDKYDKNAQVYTLTISQSCPVTPGQDNKQPFHMPVAIGLIDIDGNDLEFQVDELDGALVDDVDRGVDESATTASKTAFTVVLNLRHGSQEYTFKGIKNKPVPSLLRGFSAPVKLDYDYNRDDLLFLMSNDVDGFGRWEAGQKLAVEVIQDLIKLIQQGQATIVDERLIDACENILQQALSASEADCVDKAMVASMLVMPAESYLAELAEIADVDAIHQAREFVRQTIAERLKPIFLATYRANQSTGEYKAEATDTARRALKNIALAYLMLNSDSEIIELCVQQFNTADNMTDTSAALRALVNSADAEQAKQDALANFYQRWSQDALVVDQWFSIQASCGLPNNLETVRLLMNHKAFTMKNPNRMRSLVAGFAFQNIVNFHHRDGSGYSFLADQVLVLNCLNPQMAARMLSPLTRFRKYDARRQKLMRKQLERILAAENLSPDVFEIVSKSLP